MVRILIKPCLDAPALAISISTYRVKPLQPYSDFDLHLDNDDTLRPSQNFEPKELEVPRGRRIQDEVVDYRKDRINIRL